MSPSRAMRPIPLSIGGIPDVRDIIGRDEEAAAIAELLGTAHGVVLTGDRRVGKTSLSRLVERDLLTAGYAVARTSAQRASMAEFVSALHDAILAATPAGGVRRELERWSLELSAGPVTLTRDRVIASLDDLLRRATSGLQTRRLVLVIDEVPELARMMNDQEPGSGGQLLATLRRLRQDNSGRISMLLLGSIGFHHVSRDAPGSLNDLIKQPVGGIAHDEAIYLARCLMLGAKVDPTDDVAVADAIASVAEDVPYYVQQLVFALSRRRARVATPDDVAAVAEAALTDPEDPWDLRHYVYRIDPYYGADDAEAVSTILDVFAAQSNPLTVDEVRSTPSVAGLDDPPTRAQVVEWIEKLEQDHYLERVDVQRTRWRSELLRRAWIAGRR